MEIRGLSDRGAGQAVIGGFLRRAIASRAVLVACRLILAGVFIYAALGKIIEPDKFADAVAGFRIVPLWAVNVFAIILPWTELLCGLCLLFGVLVRSSGLLLVLLNVVFVIAVSQALARGLDIECGCFTLSHTHGKVGWDLILRDIGLLMLCLPVVLQRDEKQGSETVGVTT